MHKLRRGVWSRHSSELWVGDPASSAAGTSVDAGGLAGAPFSPIAGASAASSPFNATLALTRLSPPNISME